MKLFLKIILNDQRAHLPPQVRCSPGTGINPLSCYLRMVSSLSISIMYLLWKLLNIAQIKLITYTISEIRHICYLK